MKHNLNQNRNAIPFHTGKCNKKKLILNMQSVCFTESVDFGIVLCTFIFIVILIMQTT